MHIPKARRGGVYIMVLTAIMLILMLVTIVLGVTATSRRITARYAYTIGLFDLAVSGNEQALFLLRRYYYRLDVHIRDQIGSRAWAHVVYGVPVEFEYTSEGLRLNTDARDRHRQAFNQEAMVLLDPIVRSRFVPTNVRIRANYYRIYYRLNWDINAGIHIDEYAILNNYHGVTSLQPAGDRVGIGTTVSMYIGSSRRSSAEVRATINWQVSGYKEFLLDAYTIDTLVARGAIFPSPPYPGMIIILDVFTLAMVESLRVAD